MLIKVVLYKMYLNKELCIRKNMSFKKIGEIEIKGNRLVIKDSMIMLSQDEDKPEWPYVTIDSGIYDIQVMENGDQYSSVRIIKSGVTGTRGKGIGDVEVDHGGIGIIDYDTFLSAVHKNYDDYENWTAMELDDLVWTEASAKVKFMGQPLFFLHSGDGDGTYPVYELLESEKVVGLECDFYAED
jgi:hypothetical protein